MKHLIAILILVASAHAELVPADRLHDWAPGVNLGVQGGVTQYLAGGAQDRINIIDVTSAPYNADKTGVTDASTAIQAAIAAVTPNAGCVVYLPAGTYKLNAGLYFSAGNDGVTIRGAGKDSTTLVATSAVSSAIFCGGNDIWSWPTNGVNVTAGLSRGSTSITLADASEFTTGTLMRLSFDNLTDNAAITEGSDFFSFSVGGSRDVIAQVVRITHKDGNVLTFEPPIVHDPVDGLTAIAYVAQYQLEKFGIEGLTVDMEDSDGQYPIWMGFASNCWIHDVRVKNVKNYCTVIANSLQCEMRRSEMLDRRPEFGISSNGSAVLVNCVTGMWVEDNLLRDVFPIVEVNEGTCGSAFSYNLCENSAVEGYIPHALDANHGPHPHFNLYEGNVSPNFIADGYYGSSSHDTVHRNWIHSSCYDTSATSYSVSLNRFTRKYNLIGNVLGRSGVSEGTIVYGNPNMGNGSSSGTSEPSDGVFWADWKATGTVTARTSGSVGTITLDSGSVFDGQQVSLRWGASLVTGNASSIVGSVFTFTRSGGSDLPEAASTVNVWTQPGGYQEIDLDVENTTIEKGNYRYGASGAAGSISSLGGDTLQASYLYDAKPEWFGGLAWPPFDPTNPAAASYENIPAGYRFVNGVNPPSGASGSRRIKPGGRDVFIGNPPKRLRIGNG